MAHINIQKKIPNSQNIQKIQKIYQDSMSDLNKVIVITDLFTDNISTLIK